MSQRRHEQLQREQQFWALVRQGIGFSAACEAAGVHRRQGYRWRKAAGGRIPTAPRVVSNRYLCLQERLTIADLHLNGHGIRAIAAALDRAPSTISRELSRNATPATTRAARSKLPARPRAYLPYAAHQRAAARAARPKVAKLDDAAIGPELSAYVSAKMDLRWSPEQISRTLAQAHPDRQELRVST